MTRYFTARRHSEYFVAVPTRAAIHIQNKAPGPPATRAVATPTILPVPIVADKAVQSEAKPDTSPSPDASFYRMLNGKSELCNLESFQTDCKKQTNRNNKNNKGKSPNETINRFKD